MVTNVFGGPEISTMSRGIPTHVLAGFEQTAAKMANVALVLRVMSMMGPSLKPVQRYLQALLGPELIVVEYGYHGEVHISQPLVVGVVHIACESISYHASAEDRQRSPTVWTGSDNLRLEGTHEVTVHEDQLPQACPNRHPLLWLWLRMLAEAVVQALQ